MNKIEIVNESNKRLIEKTLELLKKVEQSDTLDITKVYEAFSEAATLWQNVTIKLMDIYFKLYNSIEVLDYEIRSNITKNIVDTLNHLVSSDDYKTFEKSTCDIFKNIDRDINVANNFGILSNEEAKTLREWTLNEIDEILCVKENIIENFRFINLEFSYHNHYMRIDGMHFNGLTNDIVINKILDKLYEVDTNCAQIIKLELEEDGKYERRVANVLSEGTMIELYLIFDDIDGCGNVKFIRQGATYNEEICVNKQEGFDVSPDSEKKDVVIDRCMNELFNIIRIVETL